jgi:hypothetical protein
VQEAMCAWLPTKTDERTAWGVPAWFLRPAERGGAGSGRRSSARVLQLSRRIGGGTTEPIMYAEEVQAWPLVRPVTSYVLEMAPPWVSVQNSLQKAEFSRNSEARTVRAERYDTHTAPPWAVKTELTLLLTKRVLLTTRVPCHHVPKGAASASSILALEGFRCTTSAWDMSAELSRLERG